MRYQVCVSQPFYFCYTDLREQLIRQEDLFWLWVLISCKRVPLLWACGEEEHHGRRITLGKKVFHLTLVEKWQEKHKDGGRDMAVFKDTASFISNEAARMTDGMQPAYSSQAHLLRLYQPPETPKHYNSNNRLISW